MLVVHVEGIFAHTAKLKNNAVVVLREVEKVSHATRPKSNTGYHLSIDYFTMVRVRVRVRIRVGVRLRARLRARLRVRVRLRVKVKVRVKVHKGSRSRVHEVGTNQNPGKNSESGISIMREMELTSCDTS